MSWWSRNSVGVVWCALVFSILLLIVLSGCKPGPTTPPPTMPGVPSVWPRTQEHPKPPSLRPAPSRSVKK